MKCKNCTRLYKTYDEESEVENGLWCDKIFDSPDVELERNCMWYKAMTHGDRIRRMADEDLAKFIRSVQCCSHYGDDCGYPFCHSMNGKLCNGIRDNTDEKLLKWIKEEV